MTHPLRWETFTEENSYYSLGKLLWGVKQRMISHHGSRFIVYSIVSPVKIVLFLFSMVSDIYTDIYTIYSIYCIYNARSTSPRPRARCGARRT